MSPIPESILLCPVCQEPLTIEPPDRARPGNHESAFRLLRCPCGHRFDAARQGYFNLLTGRGTAFEADTAAMVQARIDFLESGKFQQLTDAVCAAAKEHSVHRPVILDVGAGTGHYLSAVRERVFASVSVALDISKFALRRAARQLPGALCLVWDVWRPLPIAEGSVDLLLNIFAPRNPNEFARVCRNGGILLVVTPLPHHLREIAEVSGLLAIRPGKDDDVAASMAPSFEVVDTQILEFPMALTPTDARNVAGMGPAGHHQAAVGFNRLPRTQVVTAAFTVQVFRRHPRR